MAFENPIPLMPLTELRGAAAAIGAQLERFDGAGHPHKLRGAAIPIGARILALASDYDNLQLGVLATPRLPAIQARTVVDRASGRRYDPQVVDAFTAYLRGDAPPESTSAVAIETEMVAAAQDLVSGMVLARDLVAPSGLMMLSADHRLDDAIIRKLLDFEKSSGIALTIHVKTDPDAGDHRPKGDPADGALP